MDKITDKQVEAIMADWRKAYAAGTLPQWRIARIEKINGWVWGVERGIRPEHDLDTCHIYIWQEMMQSGSNRYGRPYGPHDMPMLAGSLHTSDGTLPGYEEDEPLHYSTDDNTSRGERRLISTLKDEARKHNFRWVEVYDSSGSTPQLLSRTRLHYPHPKQK